MLGPLEEVTVEFSSADTSTSCILPCTAVLCRLLESEGPATRGIQTMRKTMLDSLQKRFAKVKDSIEMVLACVLDPQYKEGPLVPDILTKVKTWLKRLWRTVHQILPLKLHLRRAIPKGREQKTKYPVS